MKNNFKSSMQTDLMAKAEAIMSNDKVQELLAQPGAKERLLKYLQTGSVQDLTEIDRPLVEILVSMISMYALLTAYEQHKEDITVQHYMSLLERMQRGEDLQQEMMDLVPKIPVEFKDAVRDASIEAQEVFYNVIKRK